jgi:hypothetical protein
MANTNPQAVAFANGRARPLADDMRGLYLSCKAFVQQWTGQSVATVIPNDAVVIADGAAIDGRAPITDAQVQQIFAHASNLIAYFEGATAAPVNNASMQNFNQIQAVAVNGPAIF